MGTCAEAAGKGGWNSHVQASHRAVLSIIHDPYSQIKQTPQSRRKDTGHGLGQVNCRASRILVLKGIKEMLGGWEVVSRLWSDIEVFPCNYLCLHSSYSLFVKLLVWEQTGTDKPTYRGRNRGQFWAVKAGYWFREHPCEWHQFQSWWFWDFQLCGQGLPQTRPMSGIRPAYGKSKSLYTDLALLDQNNSCQYLWKCAHSLNVIKLMTFQIRKLSFNWMHIIVCGPQSWGRNDTLMADLQLGVKLPFPSHNQECKGLAKHQQTPVSSLLQITTDTKRYSSKQDVPRKAS